MKLLGETTPTAGEVRATRSTRTARPRPATRPPTSPSQAVAIATDVLDRHNLAVAWWADGHAFTLETAEVERTVLSIPAARDLAVAILRHVDELPSATTAATPADHDAQEDTSR